VRNSSQRSYLSSLFRKPPNARCSCASPPVTTLSSNRPCDCHWNVAAICAASVGLIRPGRNATRNFSLRVDRTSIAVVTQASSHQVPVGARAPWKPICSAAEDTWVR
jgi:hypothetical protein